MATLKIAKSQADLGIVKEMAISKPVLSFAPFGEPLGKIADLTFKKTKIDFTVKYNKKGWEALRKACARTIKIQLPEKYPSVRKGETVTVHIKNGFDDRDVTGILYHVRKPYHDSESRIYYIREEFAGIPKSSRKR